jgi:hypothetical protein
MVRTGLVIERRRRTGRTPYARGFVRLSGDLGTVISLTPFMDTLAGL